MANFRKPGKKEWVLTPEAFQQFMNWLDEDQESAGQRYVEIRRRLVHYFDRKNCSSVNELADETLNRVARRLEEEGEITGTTPAQYCYLVAHYVFLESLRNRPLHMPFQEMLNAAPELDEQAHGEQQRSDCLERCMKTMDSEEQSFIVGYYQGERHIRIENRKKLAAKLGISLNALSIRACRIRNKLETCIRKCLAAKE